MSSSSVPKLYYFGFPGRAEFIRLILEDKEAKYEFVPLGMGEHQKTLGDKMPFGQLPCWEEDGHVFAQTGAIVRHVAKKNGYIPSNDLEALKADMVMEGAFEVFNKFVAFAFYKTLTKEDYEKQVDAGLKNLNKLLKQHNEGKDWFTSSISYADFAVFQTYGAIQHSAPEVAAKHTELAEHSKRVAARPNIDAYLKAGRKLPKQN